VTICLEVGTGSTTLNFLSVVHVVKPPSVAVTTSTVNEPNWNSRPSKTVSVELPWISCRRRKLVPSLDRASAGLAEMV